MRTNEPFKILADGENMFINLGDGQSIRVTNPILKGLHISMDNEIPYYGGPELESFSMDLELTGDRVEMIKSNEVLVDFFRSVTVRTLIATINDKLDKRR